ncbi:hypothetical protein FRB94_009200 [Tulasnella sp. JGI-2019a]|nr:hypothetical protein FRB94_009200 [Tulasnella sp. JGI-2019a]
MAVESENRQACICSINQLLYSRADHYADEFALGVPDKNLRFTRYTFRQINIAATLLAKYYAAQIPVRAIGDVKTKLTIGLLAPSGFDYMITEHALLRMGYCVMLISVNNAPAAVAHLLHSVKASHIIAHSAYAHIAIEAASLLPPGVVVQLINQADPEIYDSKARDIALGVAWNARVSWEEEADLPALIIHSSGSTGFPKPIVISHRAAIGNFSNGFKMSSFTTLPLYHNHGHACLHRAFYAVKPIYLFPASTLPLTATNLLGLLQQPDCNPEALFAVPYVYKLLGESEEGLELLKEFKLCTFGGSAMPQELGDKLADSGVKLVGHYGLTETGQLMTSFRDNGKDKEWIWLRLEKFAPYAVFEGQGDGTFELIVLDGWPSKNSSNRTDGSFATKDLFVKHPINPDLVKFVGRVDDTLVLVNGEKVNPTPLELTLKGGSPYILEAVVFGNGRHQTGVLVVPTSLAPISTTRVHLLKLIDPALRLANSAAPTHARLAPEMIVFLPRNAVIPKADKGSLLRPKTYAAFKDIIEKAYSQAEGLGDQDQGGKKPVGSVSNMEAELFAFVKDVAGRSEGLKVDTDLFTFGIDSLQAGRIRNLIQRTFDLQGHILPNNFVFEKPAIHDAAVYLVALTSGALSTIKEASQVEQMLQLVEKYRLFKLPAIQSAPSLNDELASDAMVVVLTGATGSLGAYLLAELLVQSAVQRVYCLCRARDDADAAHRIQASMKARNLLHLIEGGLNKRIVGLASDLSADLLGLKESKYNEIATCATIIIHNAWSVNFNLGISSFEPHIRGAVNLMSLGLVSSRQASFYFSSSVSAVAGWPGPGDVPEAVTADPNVAQKMGYARSKWVTEKLCQIASETTSLRAVVLRIGQMVGSTVDGTWNETEAVSLMIKSADTLHALPNLQESVSWLPVDYAARAILDLVNIPCLAESRESECWHVLQPRTVPWTVVLDHLKAAGLSFDVVPTRDWIDRLRRGPQNPLINPTVKLLTFYEGKYDHPLGKALPVRSPLCTEKTTAATRSLREAPMPDEALVRKFVERLSLLLKAWRKTGFLV